MLQNKLLTSQLQCIGFEELMQINTNAPLKSLQLINLNIKAPKLS